MHEVDPRPNQEQAHQARDVRTHREHIGTLRHPGAELIAGDEEKERNSRRRDEIQQVADGDVAVARMSQRHLAMRPDDQQDGVDAIGVGARAAKANAAVPCWRRRGRRRWARRRRYVMWEPVTDELSV